MTTDLITNIKVFTAPEGAGKVKANVYFTVASFLTIKGTVIDGANGLFVSLPGRKYESNGETKWASDVKTVNKEATQKLQAEILAAYNSFISNESASTGNGDATATAGSDTIPF